MWTLTFRSAILVLLGTLWFTGGSGLTNFAAKEYQALAELYYATGGIDWLWDPDAGAQWNFTAPANPCEDDWQGITCTNLEADNQVHVAVLNLNYYNLVGSLPESIGNLSYLQNLTLDYNYLSGGGLPSSLAQLQQLQHLGLKATTILNCNFTVLSELPRLQYLDLSENNIFGELSADLCCLTSVQMLALDTNQFSGHIPECIAQLTQLEILDAEFNLLSGTIPRDLGSLRNLRAFAVSVNLLTGTIPDSVGALTLLEMLDVSDNALHGSLPSSIGNFVELQLMDVSSNMLSGSLPAELTNLRFVELMNLNGNYFNGSLPEQIYQLSKLTQLSLDYNALTGTLPQYMGNMTQLVTFTCLSNQFTGQLPASLGAALQLNTVHLSDNYFSGTIPASWSSWRKLNVFTAAINHLTGPLDPYFLALPILYAFEVRSNMLSGEVPILLQPGASELEYLGMSDNKFSGQLSDGYDRYPFLAMVNYTSNQLTGTVPASMAAMNALNYLLLSSNQLSGALPEGWQHAQFLSYMFVDDNHLQGAMPESLNSLAQLVSLNLSVNLLSGPLSIRAAELPTLEVMFLSHNALSGSITAQFSDLVDSNITTVALSNNQLTGPLPESLHLASKLQVFSAVSNCFTGSIPTSLCASYSMKTLALDGLQSAPACQHKLFPSSLDGIVAKGLYSIRSPLTGGVPECLFQMDNLTTLHLSGNGLTGTLPSDPYITPTLTDLSLSHNALHGAIPSALLGRRWTNLDLSYNRLSHGLRLSSSDVYPVNASIALEQNRLSGKIPHALSSVAAISVLEGNLFSCDARESGVPRRDEYYDKYQCGSDTLNETLYAWVVIVFVLLLVCGVLYWCNRQEVESNVKSVAAQMRVWWDASAQRDTSLLHYQEVRRATVTIARVAGTSTLWCVLVLMPVYIVMSAYYGTYSHQYAWALSAAYLSGTVPFALEFVILAFLLVLVWIVFVAMRWPQSVVAKMAEAATDNNNKLVRKYAVYALCLSVSFSVALGVNIAYVTIALSQNGRVLTAAQFALALFKVAYNSACAPLLMRYTAFRVLGEVNNEDFVSIQLLVSLVNNVLIPCFVVSLINPSCFYNLFKEAEAVSTQYNYNGQCIGINPSTGLSFTCFKQEIATATTSYDPPFSYSYQCSSSFITYYAPAYVIMCILACIGIPSLQTTLAILHHRATPGTRRFTLLDFATPRLLKPVPSDSTAVPERDVFKRYFDAPQLVTTLLTYLGLLMTFGAVFPPLALCFLLTIIVLVVFARLKVGRFFSQLTSCNATEYKRIFDEECVCAGSAPLLTQSLSLISVSACLFYTLFLFDTLGDRVGLRGALWVLIVVPVSPLILVAVSWRYKSLTRNVGGDGNVQKNAILSLRESEIGTESDIELQSTTSSVPTRQSSVVHIVNPVH